MTKRSLKKKSMGETSFKFRKHLIYFKAGDRSSTHREDQHQPSKKSAGEVCSKEFLPEPSNSDLEILYPL